MPSLNALRLLLIGTGVVLDRRAVGSISRSGDRYAECTATLAGICASTLTLNLIIQQERARGEC